jgi:hypothetical protein
MVRDVVLIVPHRKNYTKSMNHSAQLFVQWIINALRYLTKLTCLAGHVSLVQCVVNRVMPHAIIDSKTTNCVIFSRERKA